MKITFEWQSYRLFPYERELGRLELSSLFGVAPSPTDTGFDLLVSDSTDWKPLARRTTYFRLVTCEAGESVVPDQANIESISNGHGNGQKTRYLSHGLHEYRGKFNPQLVRAIGNLANLQPSAWVLDPFCGSGTTLVEGAIAGWNAIGFDVNPLAVEVANAKLLALQISGRELLDAAERIVEASASYRIQATSASCCTVERNANFAAFLSRWFEPDTLRSIATMSASIGDLKDRRLQSILRVLLSDTLRVVSYQDPGDLRIRRRQTIPDGVSIRSEFMKRTSRLAMELLETSDAFVREDSRQMAILRDARECVTTLNGMRPRGNSGTFDAVITSPPYVTALPYIDTYRLSMVVLGLLEPTDLRRTERKLIGNRELLATERRNIERLIDDNPTNLPNSVMTLARDLLSAVDPERDGFRRQNMPSLTYRYFVDMQSSLIQLHSVLKPEASVSIVIGRNQTRLGGSTFVIDSPSLLSDVAVLCGYTLESLIELNTYRRFDMHNANSIRSESLLTLRRKS